MKVNVNYHNPMILQYFSNIFHLSLLNDRTFRAGFSAILAFSLVFILMPGFIKFLKKIDATSDFSSKPTTPPIFGGALVVFSVFIASLCCAVPNGDVICILTILISYASVGIADDCLKIRIKRKINLGLIEKKDYQDKADGLSTNLRLGLYFLFSFLVAILAYKLVPGLDGHLTVPFFKPSTWFPYLPNWAFILLMSFVTTAAANGTNFTDGFDSLVSVPLITCAAFVGIVAYVSGNAIFSRYLLIPHLPGVDELTPICTACIGALLAYLWYNCPPAEVYMGDGGSIGLGGALGMMFVLIKAELFLPIIGMIFVIEACSVALQIGGFKISRKFSKNKTGRRLFLRAPIHDHFRLKLKDKYQDNAQAISKVTWRFHLVSMMALIFGLILFFKVR